MKNKKLLTGMLATVLSVSMICSNLHTAQAQEVTQTQESTQVQETTPASEVSTQTEDTVIQNDETGIPDTNLYNAILKEVDTNKDDILTITEAEAITSLEAEKADIKDLTGIEYCKGLGFLSLSNNAITNISPLAKLTQLEELRLSNNKITDISALSGLTQIFEIHLSDNQITDISTVTTMTGLRWFYADNNEINDISALSGLNTNLISVSHNKITNINGLQLNGKIAYIDLSYNQLKSVTNAELNSSQINLSHNNITDISGLKGEVTRLNLSDNQIKDITSLANLPLQRLDLSNNQIRDISALATLEANDCEIVTDGNPIGQPEEEKPNDEQKPSEPEKPSDTQKPSEPEKPNDTQKPSDSTKPETSNKPIYNANDFAELLEKQDIVVKPNDSVTITFKKGSSLNNTEKTKFDFTTTITTDFTNANLPAFIKQNNFITKISYTYSGILPSEASIQIFVGEEYNGKEVFYFLLNENGTFNKNEVQKVKVENGYITVTQEHCSDYVVTTENPETLYAQSQTQNNNNTTGNNTENNNNQNNETNNDESSPQTSHDTPIGLIISVLISASALIVLYMRKYKKA